MNTHPNPSPNPDKAVTQLVGLLVLSQVASSFRAKFTATNFAKIFVLKFRTKAEERRRDMDHVSLFCLGLIVRELRSAFINS